MLEPEHASELANIIEGGLMRKATPQHIEAQMLEAGYIRKGVGGLIATDMGYKLFFEGKKNAK